MAAPTTLPALLTSLSQSLSSALDVTPKIAAIEHQKDGISLLDVKNELLLSYLQNLVFLILLKLRNSRKHSAESSDDSTELDSSVRAKLVELRLYLEKGARPLEEKLRFSIDRFLRTAQDDERQKLAQQNAGSESGESDSESDLEASDDESGHAESRKSGGLSAAPKPGALISDVTARPARRDEAPSGVYRPPKRDRQVMDAPQRREKAERRPMRSHTMEEFISTELSAAPMAEPSIGTTIVQGGRRTKTAAERKEEDERREYEEMNFTRLPKESKKDRAKKGKQGGNRMMFGGEEWRDLGEGVDRIDRLTKRKSSGGGVRALLDKSRKRGLETTDGPRGSGQMGERFQKKVRLMDAGRGSRGKNRTTIVPGSWSPIECYEIAIMEDPDKMEVLIDSSSNDEDDPVTATYNVFLNPALPHGRRLLVLQHPNRTDDAPRPPPTELRLKAGSGMVEVDMPMDHSSAYDREKGLKWGRTLQASMAAKNGGSHGLAGGFGFGAVQQRGASKKALDLEAEESLDWNEAMRQNKVLTTQTFGGQYPEADEVQHMVGVFQGSDLHLTPVSSLIHLRPQLHHIDAATQLERQAAAAASKEAAPTATGASARAIHMTIKTTADGDGVTTETMADRLRFVQSEPWRRMRYTDENEEAAWDVYNDSLFLKAPAPEGEAAAAPEADAAALPLDESVPQFATKWGDKELLEAVSGIQKLEPEPTPTPAPVKKEDVKGKQPEPTPAPLVDEARQPRLRPRGGAAGPAARRGGKGKAPTS
ncbi:DNA-directed RNA polymerase III subunit rpc5 [Paramyrothecium foliicola]|nr:DNA-directed RNA polymerase III subunit rpc5 [Paramyrothecium foliicola]